jgi:hypothetical protein
VAKSLLIQPMIVLVCLCAGACGGAGSASRPSSNASATSGEQPSSSSSSSSSPVAGYMRGDEDAPTDDEGARSDDRSTWGYGREATVAQRLAIAAVVRRYYAAAAAGDSAAACALISPRLVESSNLERDLPEEYRPAPGSALFRGKSCARVESLLFEVNHQQFVEQAATVQMIGARVKGAAGLALLGFRSTGEREVRLVLERGAWKIDVLLDRRLV